MHVLGRALAPGVLCDRLEITASRAADVARELGADRRTHKSPD